MFAVASSPPALRACCAVLVESRRSFASQGCDEIGVYVPPLFSNLRLQDRRLHVLLTLNLRHLHYNSDFQKIASLGTEACLLRNDAARRYYKSHECALYRLLPLALSGPVPHLTNSAVCNQVEALARPHGGIMLYPWTIRLCSSRVGGTIPSDASNTPRDQRPEDPPLTSLFSPLGSLE